MIIEKKKISDKEKLESDYGRIERMPWVEDPKTESELLESYHDEIEKPLIRAYALAFFNFLLLKKVMWVLAIIFYISKFKR